MASISNAGGSLTSAIVLTVLAWGVRWIRAEVIRRKQEESCKQQERGSPGRFYGELSPAALRMLVETGAQPHTIFDVRPASAKDPLPSELRGALRLPAEHVSDVLASQSAWVERFQGIAFPEPHYMLVFVGDSHEQQYRAATAAAVRGFHRTMTLRGALHHFSRGAAAQPNLRFMNRDALALLLGHGTDAAPPVRVTLIDVRRSDERALYGAITGSVHIPGEVLFAALLVGNSLQYTDTTGPFWLSFRLQWTNCPMPWHYLPTASQSNTDFPSHGRKTC
jgi:hypothetical protein